LPEDFLKVTEPTATVTSWSEKSKHAVTSDEETATLLSHHTNSVAASHPGLV
jgi:hypothetical protein